MSKEALYVVELEKVNNTVLTRAIEYMIRELSLERVHTPNFKIYNNKKISVNGICIKMPELMYPIDIYVDENNRLVVNGDEMDIKRAAGRIKQFYEAMGFSMKYNAPMVYNEKEQEIELLLEEKL